jgi:hypothetical protein
MSNETILNKIYRLLELMQPHNHAFRIKELLQTLVRNNKIRP